MLPYLQSVLQALFPSTCVCCGEVLLPSERQVCLGCYTSLATTGYSAHDDNHTERLLTGRIPFVHATSLLYFRQGDNTQRVVHAMKFQGNSELCVIMGVFMGQELLRSARFDDVDILVPLPLHWRRRLQRGYNQSELLCRGIARVLKRPVCKGVLVRHRYTHQQSLLSSAEREDNVDGAFSLRRPERLRGSHILLVDDVMTTGATLASCCQPLTALDDVKISIATLSIAG